MLTTDEALSKIFTQAGTNEALEGPDRVRYNSFTTNMLRVYENAYLQRKDGSISDRLMIDFTDMPAFTPYWTDRKHWVSDDFAAYLESEIISTPAKRPIINEVLTEPPDPAT